MESDSFRIRLNSYHEIKKSPPCKRTRNQTRVTTLIHKQLTLPVLASVRQHSGSSNVNHSVIAYYCLHIFHAKTNLVRSSGMYSESAFHAPLINRLLSVCSTNYYFFPSKPVYASIIFIIATEKLICQCLFCDEAVYFSATKAVTINKQPNPQKILLSPTDSPR